MVAARVLAGRDKFEMVGVEAALLAAEMVDNQSLRYLAPERKVRSTMGAYRFPLEASFAVAPAIDGLLPNPTSSVIFL